MENQKGFTTLFISVILVLLVTLNVFIGSKGSYLELASANNLYRAEVAFENAEEGVVAIYGQLKQDLSRANGNYRWPVEADSYVPTSTGKYAAKYFYDPANPSDLPFIISKGYEGQSQSGAIRTVKRYLILSPGNPGLTKSVDDALTALGNVAIGGNADVASVKSGGTVSTSGSGSVTSSTPNTTEFKVALLDSQGNILKDASGNTVYRGMTTDEYFMLYFGGFCPTAAAANNPGGCIGEAKATIGALSKGYICQTDCSNANLKAQYDIGKRIMWLEQGGMHINANVILGSPSDPVLILVMNSGTVQINGTSKIYGVVYVDVPDAITYGTCSCTATESATAIQQTSNTVTKTKYTLSSNGNSGAIKCTTNGGCTDGLGTTTISKNSYYTVSNVQQTVYTTTGVTWSDISYALTPNANNAPACTQSACTAATNKCTPSGAFTSSTKIGDASSCSYAATQVSGTNNTPVQIDVLGTWDNSGGGNALIEGAAITSGNFSTTGGINLVKNSDVVINTPGKDANLDLSPQGWTDLIKANDYAF